MLRLIMRTNKHVLCKHIRKYKELYIFVLPAVIYFLIFHYMPMFGLQIAFKKFMFSKGIMGSPWIGFDHFNRLIESYFFKAILRNTLVVSFYSIIAGFPLPIILALSLHQVQRPKIKKVIQTTIYAPHFVSVVVIVSMLFILLSPTNGIVNIIIQKMGGEKIFFMGKAGWFPHLYVLSNIWQHAGFATIVYIAALSGVDSNLYEAAVIDGANKIQKIVHIDIPWITPTIVVLFILRAGRVMAIGFEKAYLMQTPSNLKNSEIIATYVYKMGLEQAQFGFATAVGMFNSIINLLLILTVNYVAKRLNQSTLW